MLVVYMFIKFQRNKYKILTEGGRIWGEIGYALFLLYLAIFILTTLIYFYTSILSPDIHKIFVNDFQAKGYDPQIAYFLSSAVLILAPFYQVVLHRGSLKDVWNRSKKIIKSFSFLEECQFKVENLYLFVFFEISVLFSSFWFSNFHAQQIWEAYNSIIKWI